MENTSVNSNNDIFFKESEKYFYKKQNLLSKNKISYEDMENFIVDTRGSLYTQFYRCRKRKMDLKSCFTDIYLFYWLIFKNCVNIKLDSIVDFIAKVGFDDNYGARPLKRAVQSKIEDKIAEEILDGNIKEGSHIILKAEEDKVIISLK